MSRNEFTYLAAVAVMAVVMSAMLLWPASNAPNAAAVLWDVEGASAGSGGVTRQIDPALFDRLIQERRLSGHEAAYYQTLEQEKELPGDNLTGP